MEDKATIQIPAGAPPPPAKSGDLVMQAQRQARKRKVLLQHAQGQPIRVLRPADPEARRAIAKAHKKFRRHFARTVTAAPHLQPAEK